MSGHSKWSQIKHKKAATDQKKAQTFAKLLKAVSVVAKEEPSPEFNPALRAAIDRARQANVPNNNIERAIKNASELKNLEKITAEAYGPGGVAVLIEAVTDNRNRTISEIKHLLSKHNGKWAEPGSVLWAFKNTGEGWEANFPQEISSDDKEKLGSLVNALTEHESVQAVYTNAQ